MDIGAYHVLELQIASNPADARRVMPAIRSEHRRILDVGCGAGQTLLASSLGAEVTAIGIDRDMDALKLGKRLGGAVRFVCSKGESLPLGDGSFDLVISRVGLPYMKTSATLAEMTRVLAPGGSLWLALHPFEKAKRELADCVRRMDVAGALHRLYVMANGASLHFAGQEFASPASGRYESFQTEEAMRRQLEALGYEDIRVRRNVFFVITATKPKR
jgi:ubiquinone/menaquinone biosynthesis C-methylase UbiE